LAIAINQKERKKLKMQLSPLREKADRGL